MMCNKDKFWRALRDPVERPDRKSDPLYWLMKGRLAHGERLAVELDTLLQRHARTASIVLIAGRVPASPVNEVAEAADTACLAEEAHVLKFEHPHRRVRSAAPRVRRHSNRVAPAPGAQQVCASGRRPTEQGAPG